MIEPFTAETISFTQIAEAIGDARMSGVLEQLADRLRYATEAEKRNPKRAAVLQSLENVTNAAVTLDKRLEASFGFLLLEDAPSVGELCERLKDLGPIIERAKSRIQSGAGRGRVPYVSARGTCACIIAEVWTITRKKEPGKTNERVQNICRLYWDACGGSPIGKNGDPAVWRRELEKASAPDNSMRRHVHRLVGIAVQNRYKKIANSVP